MTSGFLCEASSTEVWFTLGPASASADTLTQLFQAGASGVRLTFSFGTPLVQSDRAHLVRQAAAAAGVRATIVADLAGEKVRLGKFGSVDEIYVNAGDTLTIVSTLGAFDAERRIIPVGSTTFTESIRPPDRLLIGDGAVVLEVERSTPEGVVTRVLRGGTINATRGIIAQSKGFQPACWTDKDRNDLRHIAASRHFDAVALSFVAGPADVQVARDIMRESGTPLPIIAKIETLAGVRNAEEIARAADAVMIARGDLALFLPWPKLGSVCRRVARVAKAAGKPYVLATQLVEGLERFSFPTRAEICDVSGWVGDGAAALMLSYETAFGTRPVDAVAAVQSIIDATRDPEVPGL